MYTRHLGARDSGGTLRRMTREQQRVLRLCVGSFLTVGGLLLRRVCQSERRPERRLSRHLSTGRWLLTTETFTHYTECVINHLIQSRVGSSDHRIHLVTGADLATLSSAFVERKAHPCLAPRTHAKPPMGCMGPGYIPGIPMG